MKIINNCTRIITLLNLLVVVFCCIPTYSFAKADSSSVYIEKKELMALRTSDTITVDGALTEKCWKEADTADDFYIFSPNNGAKAEFKSEVKLIYDDEALYVGAILYDPMPDSISMEMGKRDEENINTDVFSISLCPYNDGQNYFHYKITPANIQIDEKESSNSRILGWNPVWESQTQITDVGWVVEMKIPYASFTFPKANNQPWGVNFWRVVKRRPENASWNFIDRKLELIGTQSGLLTNINNIKPHIRLSASPNISSNIDRNTANKGNAYSYKVGMDVSYGINQSYTLDMMLIPDFGQTMSVDKTMTLENVEIRYEENRPFFTDGTELFTKSGLFYSPRIGSAPNGYEEVVNQLQNDEEIRSNPTENSIINATKVTGRSSKGLGVGVFNAVTNNTYAEVENTNGERKTIQTDYLTNYNMFALDQTYGKRSFVNLINTNAFSPGRNRTANVTGTIFNLANKANTWSFDGMGSVSNIKDNNVQKLGHSARFFVKKMKGNLTWYYRLMSVSDQYDNNDMGFITGQDINMFSHFVNVKYAQFKPSKYLQGWQLQSNIFNSNLYVPRTHNFLLLQTIATVTFLNNSSLNGSLTINPKEQYNYIEPRVPGRFFTGNKGQAFDITYDTDKRKALSCAFNIKKTDYNGQREGYSFSLSPSLRMSDKLTVNLFCQILKEKNNYGSVNWENSDSIIFGRRKIQSLENRFTGKYAFSNISHLSFKIRHYWYMTIYDDSYYLLEQDGILSDYYGDYSKDDNNSNIFNIELVYSWNFAPGSFLYVIYKTNINSSKEEIYYDYLENFNQLINDDRKNRFSVKFSYYLDYQRFKKQ